MDDQTLPVVGDILRSHAEELGYTDPVFINAGASAAIFRVLTPAGLRAVKTFDPRLFQGPEGDATRRRLDLQRTLIGPSCPNLVHTFRVDEGHGTAFVEMEYVEWPQLTSRLPDIPDDAVQPLIGQLVDAVRFLEELKIVHRDIKPDNIHVAPDFSALKLLDLGVARPFLLDEAHEAAATDQDRRRPFLATAQYSSPEYLFRLDAPTDRLWRGLNLYQVGAVLHDLVMKRQLFAEEVATGNKYVVARAVLLHLPSFDDDDAGRLRSWKALSARCLVKDLDTRLQTVSWEDFGAAPGKDPLEALEAALARKARQDVSAGRSAAAVNFKRTEFLRRLSERTRAAIVSIAGPRLPSVIEPSEAGDAESTQFCLVFTYQPSISILFRAECEWLGGVYDTTANIRASAYIRCEVNELPVVPKHHLCTTEIDQNEAAAIDTLTQAIARSLTVALDQIALTENICDLHGFDLLAEAVQ